jgi:hypothetical protein
MAAFFNFERKNGMFQQEEMSDQREGTAYGYASEVGFEEASLYHRDGQKLSGEASGQAPTAVQPLALALVSLGMLMGTTILLTILAGAPSAPSWAVFSLLYVLTLFAAAAVSINVVFNRMVW